jgi:hypothetical protein
VYTALEHAEGGWRDPDAFAAELTALTLGSRNCLPHRLNGRAPLPSDPYAAGVWKDMGSGKSQEFKRIDRLFVANLVDGVPLPVVLDPLRRLISRLSMHPAARQHRAQPRCILSLNRREQKVDGSTDYKQMRLAELYRTAQGPARREVLADTLSGINAHITALEELRDAITLELAR